MRVVLDTNTVISGLLWDGPASRLLVAARERRIELFTSAALLAELADVLPRVKFAKKRAAAQLTPEQLAHRYALLAATIIPADVAPRVEDDPADDAVLACALAAYADLIVSGDAHLLNLARFHGIPIVKSAAAIDIVSA
ncbi:MAG: putative toxin-antitoxin system toxin component, PIN family [Betaproteobacteria bacterium]|nr:putative toxin-antitoxin system toxin component, PIN family [Betaproteobacteria bacterium]